MSNPYLIVVPFCNTGNKNTIQLTRQSSQDPEDATYQDGFPPITMLNEDAGGLAPKGLDFNGIFYELSSSAAHYCRGDRIQFDATYATAIGGYAKGAIVASNDYQKDYISLIDNNLADPNGTNTTWSVYAGQGSVPVATSTTTGTVKIVNNLASSATDAALTANQGRILKEIFDKFEMIPSQRYVKIPIGSQLFIIQWGDGVALGAPASSSANVVFPIQFPNACFHVGITVQMAATDQLGYSNRTNTGFTINKGNNDSTARVASWIAIGY